MCLPPKINVAVNTEGDIFAKGGSFSFRRTWVNYIPAVTKEKPYDHEDTRKIDTSGRILQNVPMMDFQAKVSMLLRMALKDANVVPPLTGQFKVEISIKTDRPVGEIPLLYVAKSIMDGINKEIIIDDHSIFSCSISYKQRKSKSKTPRTKSPDELEIRLFGCNSSSNTPVISLMPTRIHVVPKAEPLLLNYEIDARLSLQDDFYPIAVSDDLLKDGMRVAGRGPVRLQMSFLGNVLSKDIDNMARMYYPILENLGLLHDDVWQLDLIKQQAVGTKSYVEMELFKI